MDTDRGLFISFDGVPRSGRSTYAQHLHDALTSPDHGYTVTRVALTAPPILRLCDEAWLAATIAEADHIHRTVVMPALCRGEVVIADGWITSALIRARVAMRMPTDQLVAAWSRATVAQVTDVEYVFPEALAGDPSPLTPSANDWQKLCASRPVAYYPAHPMMPRNERRVFPRSLPPERTKFYITRRTSELLLARTAVRVADEWHHDDIIAESREDRDLRQTVARMNEWDHPPTRKERGLPRDAEGVELAVRWPHLSDAVRAAALAVLGDEEERLRAFQVTLENEGVTDPTLDARIAAYPMKQPVEMSGPPMIG